MDGLKGLLAKADVDVIVERPARMLVSVRSFFEQPMYIFATDGVTATLFDGTQPSGSLFLKGPVKGSLLKHLLQVSLWPQEAVGLFLGAPPVEGSQALQLDVNENTGLYAVGTKAPHGPVVVTHARLQDDAVVKLEVYDKKGEVRFKVDYDDIRDVDGIPLAHHLVFHIPEGDDAMQKVHFVLVDVELNGAPFDDAAFSVALPPGATFQPLSLLQAPVPPAPPPAEPNATQPPTASPEHPPISDDNGGDANGSVSDSSASD